MPLHHNGIGAAHVMLALSIKVPARTLQYRLKHLVAQQRIVIDGQLRWATYRLANTNAPGGNTLAFIGV